MGTRFQTGIFEKNRRIYKKLSYRPIIAAFTATATDDVREDIIRILKLNNPYVKVTGFNRENLYFEVQRPKDKFTALCDILDSHKNQSAIVYCSTRKTVEEVCERLNDNGYDATRYHAGLDDDERQKNQDDFIYDRCEIMVATNAFGMGIDKSNVYLVVHYNMPKNIESYYQEAGRADVTAVMQTVLCFTVPVMSILQDILSKIRMKTRNIRPNAYQNYGKGF